MKTTIQDLEGKKNTLEEEKVALTGKVTELQEDLDALEEHSKVAINELTGSNGELNGKL